MQRSLPLVERDLCKEHLLIINHLAVGGVDVVSCDTDGVKVAVDVNEEGDGNTWDDVIEG